MRSGGRDLPAIPPLPPIPSALPLLIRMPAARALCWADVSSRVRLIVSYAYVKLHVPNGTRRITKQAYLVRPRHQSTKTLFSYTLLMRLTPNVASRTEVI